jgi:hypothetical protein
MPRTPGPADHHHGSYTANSPRDYRPSFNAPSVNWTKYDLYESPQVSFAHTPPIRTDPSRHFIASSPELFGMLSIPKEDLALEELWLMAMGVRPRPQEGPIVMSADEFAFVNGEVRTNLNLRDNLKVRPLPDISDITDALSQLEKVLPKDHPDIINLINAADKLTNGQFSADRQTSQMPEPLSAAENPDVFDPYEEAEQFFNQQMQILEKSFELPMLESDAVPQIALHDGTALGTGTFELEKPAVNHDLEGIVQADEQLLLQAERTIPVGEPAFQLDTVPQEMPNESTLEQIIENEATFEPPQQFIAEDMMPVADMPGPQAPEPMVQDFNYGTATVIDEINQAIDQLKEDDMQQNPFQQLYDPLMAQQYMFDPMMQYMQDYMMPGPMPFGPMGPMLM